MSATALGSGDESHPAGLYRIPWLNCPIRLCPALDLSHKVLEVHLCCLELHPVNVLYHPFFELDIGSHLITKVTTPPEGLADPEALCLEP